MSDIQADWSPRWSEALGLWSRYTKLGEPVWCLTAADERREGLTESFAMIRLEDKAVVISLRQVSERGLEAFPLEIMGHEIGHHVYCPADLTDQGRMIARMRRALPTKEHLAGFVANLYADLLINNRLQRSAELDMAGVFRKLGGGSQDRLWTLYMRFCELLWGLKTGTIATGELTADLDGDARLGAQLARNCARDWLDGSGRFAALLFPYLINDAAEARVLLKGWLDTEQAAEGGEPDGLVEIEPGEEEGAVHPALDGTEAVGLEGSDGDESQASDGVQPEGGKKPPRRFRDPGEYHELLKSLGLELSESEAAIRYYRERALPHLVPFPTRRVQDAAEPLPEGLDVWDAGSPLEEVDWIESVLASPNVVPGVTTMRRMHGVSQGSEPERIPVDLYLGVDCSGSMVNPQRNLSYSVLAGAVMLLSALRAGAKVKVVLSGEPGQTVSTPGFVRDWKKALGVLTGYLGSGTTFGIPRLEETFAARKPTDRAVHILIVTDNDIFWMLDQAALGRKGWDIAADALRKARGGGTYVLHRTGRDKGLERMERQGWKTHNVTNWEEVLDFARAFSREKYGQEVKTARA